MQWRWLCRYFLHKIGHKETLWAQFVSSQALWKWVGHWSESLLLEHTSHVWNFPSQKTPKRRITPASDHTLSCFQAATHLQVSFRVSTSNFFACPKTVSNCTFSYYSISKLPNLLFCNSVFACPHCTFVRVQDSFKVRSFEFPSCY